MSCSWSKFLEVYWLTPKWPWHVQGQKHPWPPPLMCILHNTSLLPNCLFVLLYNEQFSRYGPIWRKWPWHVREIKVPICIPHTPLRPKCYSFSLYNEPFSSYSPILGKVQLMTPICLWRVEGQKHPHALCKCTFHTPPMPKFSSVSLYDELF